MKSQHEFRKENLLRRFMKKWELGFSNKNGASEYGIIIENTHELVIGCINKDLAEHLIETHNNWLDNNFGKILS